jgi:hypothetical protein
MYHIRSTGNERHTIQTSQQKLEEEALNVEAIKVRHRDMLSVEQPALRLEQRPRRLFDRTRERE